MKSHYRIAHKLTLITFLIISLIPTSHADQAKLVKIPLIYTQINKPDLLTPACMEFKEKNYDKSWEEFKVSAQTLAEKALVETLTAMQQKDLPRLTVAAHPAFIARLKEFEQQAAMYFTQIATIQIKRVKDAFVDNDQGIFHIEVEYKGKSDYVKFAFQKVEGKDAYGFLQNFEGKQIAASINIDWFSSSWGPRKSQTPTYCTSSDFTHKVSLGEGSSAIFLKGNPATEKYEAVAHLNRLYGYITAGKMEDYFDGLKEKERYRDWFLNQATESERKQFVEHTTTSKPIFVFDLNPIFVIYTQRPSKTIDSFDVLYFLRDSEGKLKLQGQSFGSTFDNIFRNKKLRTAAEEEVPFKSMEILR